jgi:aminotransferase
VNPAIARIEPSLIRAIHERKRPGDIDLGLGEPTVLPDLEAFADALEWTRLNGSRYAPNAGFADLRELLAAYLARSDWAAGPLSSRNVCVTVGSEEALYLAIKTVVDPARHEVLIVEPSYLAYAKICVLENVRYRAVALDGDEAFRPDASRVLAEMRPDTRLVILNSPSNPTGRVWPAEELRALASGLAISGRDDVYVLSDEVYREIHFGASPPASIATWHAASLVAGSLSKSNALTGLRLGWIAGPDDVIAAATKVHQFVNTGTSAFAQRVAVHLLSRERLGDHLPIYTAARKRLIAAASRAGLDLIPPEGTFYGLIRLPPALASESMAVAERLLNETRVATVPGRAFGASGEGWLRISWVAPIDSVEEGLKRIGDWLRAEQA